METPGVQDDDSSYPDQQSNPWKELVDKYLQQIYQKESLNLQGGLDSYKEHTHLFEPESYISNWGELDENLRVQILKEVANHKNSVIHKEGVLDSPEDEIDENMFDQFKPRDMSLIYSDKGLHENWENERSAPTEAILQMQSNEVYDYDAYVSST